jgi:hypothetical protein
MQAVLQMRAQRQQQQAQQQAMQNASAAVQGAQVLSQTPVGGGHSALTAMLSGGAGGGVGMPDQSGQQGMAA